MTTTTSALSRTSRSHSTYLPETLHRSPKTRLHTCIIYTEKKHISFQQLKPSCVGPTDRSTCRCSTPIHESIQKFNAYLATIYGSIIMHVQIELRRAVSSRSIIPSMISILLGRCRAPYVPPSGWVKGHAYVHSISDHEKRAHAAEGTHA